MDRPDCDLASLRDALETIDRAGRWSGRDRLLAGEVVRLLEGRPPGELGILDVGAGGGHGAERLARRVAREGWRPRVVLADLHAGALRIARERLGGGSGAARAASAGSRAAGAARVGSRAARAAGEPTDLRLVRLTGAALPFRRAGFDVAVSTATLHHLERADAVRLLAEMARVSRFGWVVVDLRRSRFVYAAARFLADTLWRRHPYPRWDGPASVRRAFTAPEARELVRGAGLDGATVLARPCWIAIRSVPGGAGGAGVVARSVASRAGPSVARGGAAR